MTNEQIRDNICEKLELLKTSFSNPCLFELNPQVMIIKQEIEDLKRKCTHKNSLNQYSLSAGNRCEYCGCVVKEENNND